MVSLEQKLSGICAASSHHRGALHRISLWNVFAVSKQDFFIRHFFFSPLSPSSPPLSAVILPTIWRYLQILEAPPYFLGLGLSAFSLSGLLTGPLFGFWSDRSETTKSIILFSNLFEIAGEQSNHKTNHMMWGVRP